MVQYMGKRSMEYEDAANFLIQAMDGSAVKVGKISGYKNVTIAAYKGSSVSTGDITYR